MYSPQEADWFAQLSTETLCRMVSEVDGLCRRATAMGHMTYAETLIARKRALIDELNRRQTTVYDFLDAC